MGAGRNLTAGEIVGQYLVIAAERGLAAESVNLVFMGMGEPLLNVPNVLRALDLFEREIAPRRITLSTSGVVPGLAPVAARTRRPNLAVSLSAPDDATRTRLMPINATCPIGALFDALVRWPLEKGRRITFEYVLIEGVNDTPAMARALARLVARAVEGEPDPPERVPRVAARSPPADRRGRRRVRAGPRQRRGRGHGEVVQGARRDTAPGPAEGA